VDGELLPEMSYTLKIFRSTDEDMEGKGIWKDKSREVNVGMGFNEHEQG